MAYNLQDLARTDIEETIDSTIVEDVLSRSPFLPLPTALNIRDLGLLNSGPIKPGLVFSSGFISHLSVADQQTLVSKHDVKKIYDLRTKAERERMPEPEIAGADMIWVETELNPKTEISDFADEDGVPGYVKGYTSMLRSHKDAFGRVIKDLASNENGGSILYHCTAGKDRTGILSAILLSLAGASDELIAHNYALSRIGVEPAREALMKALKLSCPPDVTYETPGFKAMCSMKEEYMLAFLDALSEFGGVEGYCRDFLGMNGEEIEVVRKKLKGM